MHRFRSPPQNQAMVDAAIGEGRIRFLAAMKRGWLRHDACAIGFEVDASCCAVGADGSTRPAVRAVGPPTAGTFGDPIAAQIHRMLPDALGTLVGAGAAA